MVKDKLGLEWRAKKHPDEPVYTILIIMLLVGAAIIITTAFLTRQAPEPYTELYYNDHIELPEYVNLDTGYDYSFSIHNLENTDKTYNYTVTTEYYALDYSCESPELWLTNKTETDDPALYIREERYGLGFDYDIKKGNKISLSLVEPKGREIYTIYIENDKIWMDDKKFNITKKEGPHRLRMSVDPTYIKVVIDSQIYRFSTPKEYTHGYIQLQTYDTYAEFTSMYIERGTDIDMDKGIEKDSRYPIYVKLADAIYHEQILMNTTGKYYVGTPINLTSYTVKTSFRLNAVSLDLRENVKIISDKNILMVTENNVTKTFKVDSGTVNTITTKVTNKSIQIYYNDEYVTSIGNNGTEITPQITYSNATIDDFYVKSDDAPLTIKYKIPYSRDINSNLITVETLKYISGASEYNPTFTNITEGLINDVSIRELMEQEKITTENYRITTSYIDADGRLKMALAGLGGNIYSIVIDDGKARIQYTSDNRSQTEEVNVTILNNNDMYVDARNGTLAFYFNSKRIFSQKAITTGGILLFDYDNVTLTSAKLQDRNTGEIITYQEQQSECTPILVKRYSYKDGIYLPDKGTATINGTSAFNQTFDIAKVQVSLDNGQEIHYWVRLR